MAEQALRPWCVRWWLCVRATVGLGSGGGTRPAPGTSAPLHLSAWAASRLRGGWKLQHLQPARLADHPISAAFATPVRRRHHDPRPSRRSTVFESGAKSVWASQALAPPQHSKVAIGRPFAWSTPRDSDVPSKTEESLSNEWGRSTVLSWALFRVAERHRRGRSRSCTRLDLRSALQSLLSTAGRGRASCQTGGVGCRDRGAVPSFRTLSGLVDRRQTCRRPPGDLVRPATPRTVERVGVVVGGRIRDMTSPMRNAESSVIAYRHETHHRRCPLRGSAAWCMRSAAPTAYGMMERASSTGRAGIGFDCVSQRRREQANDVVPRGAGLRFRCSLPTLPW